MRSQQCEWEIDLEACQRRDWLQLEFLPTRAVRTSLSMRPSPNAFAIPINFFDAMERNAMALAFSVHYFE